MESLNMSKLNLCSAKTNNSSSTKTETEIYLQEDGLEQQIMSEYRQDIWNNLLKAEEEKPKIILQSPQLQFRGALVCELRRYVKKLGLTYGTLHTAVYLLDLFMNSHDLRSDRLTDVAIVCLSLAAKSEERNNSTPNHKRVKSVTGREISGLGSLEYAVARHALWRLTAPTAATIATLIAPLGQSSSADVLMRKILDLTLSDVRLSTAPASRVGCACVAAARARRGLCPWPPPLRALTKYIGHQITPIADLLLRMLDASKVLETGITRPDLDQGYFSKTPETSKTSQSVHTLVPITSPVIFQPRPLSLDQYRYRIVRNCRSNVLIQVPVRVVPYVNQNENSLGADSYTCRPQRLLDAALVSDNSLKRRAEEMNNCYATKRVCKTLN